MKVKLRKQFAGHGHNLVIATLEDGRSYQVTTSDTIATDNFDDEDSDKQEESINALCSEIQRANHLDEDWNSYEY